MEYITIEIDLDIHKKIEAERCSFSEKYNDILRRKYGLEPMMEKVSDVGKSINSGWRKKGVFLPDGTEWFFSYNGKSFTGKIAQGSWVYENRGFTQPSTVVSKLAVTKQGRKTRLDGWRYMKVKRPNEREWHTLDNLKRMLS